MVGPVLKNQILSMCLLNILNCPFYTAGFGLYTSSLQVFWRQQQVNEGIDYHLQFKGGSVALGLFKGPTCLDNSDLCFLFFFSFFFYVISCLGHSKSKLG